MLTKMLPCILPFTIKLEKNLLTSCNFLAQNLPKPFNRRAMDWAGFARSVRQTIDSVMFLCSIQSYI
jgi:hypothetical protein